MERQARLLCLRRFCSRTGVDIETGGDVYFRWVSAVAGDMGTST